MIVEINVKQEHIDKGLPNNCNNCPVALAFKEAMPDYDIVVYGQFVKLYKGKEYLGNYELPIEAKVIVYRTDRGMYTKPVKFTVSLTTKKEQEQ